MKDFFHIMGKYFAHYKRYIIGTFGFNILAAVFNVFSFTVLLPILQILFKVNTERYHFIEWGTGDFLETAKNNGYYYSQVLIDNHVERRGDRGIHLVDIGADPRQDVAFALF